MKLNKLKITTSIINESVLVQCDLLEVVTFTDNYSAILRRRDEYGCKYEKFVKSVTKRIAKKRLVKKYLLCTNVAHEILWDEKRQEFYDVLLKEDDKYYYVSDSYTLLA